MQETITLCILFFLGKAAIVIGGILSIIFVGAMVVSATLYFINLFKNKSDESN